MHNRSVTVPVLSPLVDPICPLFFVNRFCQTSTEYTIFVLAYKNCSKGNVPPRASSNLLNPRCTLLSSHLCLTKTSAPELPMEAFLAAVTCCVSAINLMEVTQGTVSVALSNPE